MSLGAHKVWPGRVVLRPVIGDHKTKGGVLLPTADVDAKGSQDRTYYGRVVSASSCYVTNHGQMHFPSDYPQVRDYQLKPGDYVAHLNMYPKMLNDGHVVIKIDDILVAAPEGQKPDWFPEESTVTLKR